MKTHSTSIHGGLRSALGALLAGAFLAGCSQGPQLTTHGAGHAITAEIAGSHSLATDAERAVLGGQFGQVTIERTRVRIDNLAWTQIPANVPVEVSIVRGRQRVRAGSVTIERRISDQ